MASDYQLVETLLQEVLADKAVRCNLCHWRCRLQHGQRGFCQAHVNRHGKLYNLTYGIISSIATDAIEDKPVQHYRPGTMVLSIGSYGCNFRCAGCHNTNIAWGLSTLDQLARGVAQSAFIKPAEIIEIAMRQKVDGIAFTYSEPAIWLEYVIDVAKLAQQHGLYTVYVSNGSLTEQSLGILAPYLDVLCSDIKSLRDEIYQQNCAVAEVSSILKTIIAAHELGIHVENRTNIIPGSNDQAADFRAIATWIKRNLGAQSPWHITRFFPAHELSHLPPTPLAIMESAVQIGKDSGLENVHIYYEKGCDCAHNNLPVDAYLNKSKEEVYTKKQCSGSCCGTDGIVLKKYEQAGQ